MHVVRSLLPLALMFLLACGDTNDPGAPEDQECEGTLSGAGSGALSSCTLEAQRVDGKTSYSFKFQVSWSTGGDPTEGQILFWTAEAPAPGEYAESAFSEVVGSVFTPGGEECTISAGLEQDHGSMAVNIRSVPDAEDLGIGDTYEFFTGSMLATFTQNPIDSDCPGAMQLNATFAPRRP